MAEFFEGNLLGFDHLPRYHLVSKWISCSFFPSCMVKVLISKSFGSRENLREQLSTSLLFDLKSDF